jgi:hypothetical protein
LTRPKKFEVDVGMTRRCQQHCFSIDLSASQVITNDHFFLLLRPFLFPLKACAWQIKLVLSADLGS